MKSAPTKGPCKGDDEEVKDSVEAKASSESEKIGTEETASTKLPCKGEGTKKPPSDRSDLENSVASELEFCLSCGVQPGPGLLDRLIEGKQAYERVVQARGRNAPIGLKSERDINVKETVEAKQSAESENVGTRGKMGAASTESTGKDEAAPSVVPVAKLCARPNCGKTATTTTSEFCGPKCHGLSIFNNVLEAKKKESDEGVEREGMHAMQQFLKAVVREEEAKLYNESENVGTVGKMGAASTESKGEDEEEVKEDADVQEERFRKIAPCLHCNIITHRRCARCRITYICSRACQMATLAEHKPTCIELHEQREAKKANKRNEKSKHDRTASNSTYDLSADAV